MNFLDWLSSFKSVNRAFPKLLSRILYFLNWRFPVRHVRHMLRNCFSPITYGELNRKYARDISWQSYVTPHRVMTQQQALYLSTSGSITVFVYVIVRGFSQAAPLYKYLICTNYFICLFLFLCFISKVTVNLPLRVTNFHVMKMYGGVDV